MSTVSENACATGSARLQDGHRAARSPPARDLLLPKARWTPDSAIGADTYELDANKQHETFVSAVLHAWPRPGLSSSMPRVCLWPTDTTPSRASSLQQAGQTWVLAMPSTFHTLLFSPAKPFLTAIMLMSSLFSD